MLGSEDLQGFRSDDKLIVRHQRRELHCCQLPEQLAGEKDLGVMESARRFIFREAPEFQRENSRYASSSKA